MRVVIAAIGKFKPSAERELFTAYCKRISWDIELKEIQDTKIQTNAEQRKDREAELLIEAVSGCDRRIALDERGKEITSIAFAHQLQEWRDDNNRSIGFLIGGADGHGSRVRETADFSLAFGKMTWPHMMIRAMLAEQLYRAYSIQQNHPYHRA